MKKLNLLTLLLSFIMMTGCHPCKVQEITATVKNHIHLSDLSSASAVWYYNNSLYLAGDDVPWLYQLNNEFKITNKNRLSNIDSLVNGRTPGSIKADFESMDIFSLDGTDMVLVLPSGSKEIARDTAYLISLSNEKVIYKRNIRRLFKKIIAHANIQASELNIEGLAIDDNHVYLLQRGNITDNFVVKIPRGAFFNFFQHHTIVPDISLFHHDLPKSKEVSSGFSGACILPDQSGMLFTASLENTTTALADGEVQGSYIGFIPFCKMSSGAFSITKLMHEGRPFAKKLEGITIKNSLDENHFEVITVCDNDDGTSDIIELTIGLN